MTGIPPVDPGVRHALRDMRGRVEAGFMKVIRLRTARAATRSDHVDQLRAVACHG